MDTAARRANARRAAVMWSLGLAGALGPPAARLQICLGPLAQWVEQRTFNPRVPGSSPGRPTRLTCCDARLDQVDEDQWCHRGCNSWVLGREAWTLGRARAACRGSDEPYPGDGEQIHIVIGPNPAEHQRPFAMSRTDLNPWMESDLPNRRRVAKWLFDNALLR